MEHPKILLIDTPPDVESTLKTIGYNVSYGSLGVPYSVPKSAEYQPVMDSSMLPAHLPEFEIVIIDLSFNTVVTGKHGTKRFPDEITDWWCRCTSGIIDPRPRVASELRPTIEAIVSAGGSVLVFVDPFPTMDFVKGGHDVYGRFRQTDTIRMHDWLFMKDMVELNVLAESGIQSTVVPSEPGIERTIAQLLSSHMQEGKFTCTLNPDYYTQKRFEPLLKQKYGRTISGLVGPRDNDRGISLIVPQISDKAGFICSYLKDVLPNILPHLFPEFTGRRWVHWPEYELPQVSALEQEITNIELEAKSKIALARKQISIEIESWGFLHDLLTESGRSLVLAVRKTLDTLGFENVVDADEAKNEEELDEFSEDLRIEGSPLLLIEVKGLGGLPTEDDALQGNKYVAQRIRELDRKDVLSLSIINQQKHLPCLERNNDSLFTRRVLDNAAKLRFGLMTTFDLHRLARSYLDNRWNHDVIAGLFYQQGRIPPVPLHYEHVGNVEKYWDDKNVVSINVNLGALAVGDQIAFELPMAFAEQTVESMEHNNVAISEAKPEMRVGIKSAFAKDIFRHGVRVFRIKA